MSTLVFTGHMVDRPGRATPRFPASLIPQVEARLAALVRSAKATDGYASGACGGDILFHEAMIAAGCRTHVTLPCQVDAFRTDCVDVIPNSDWAARFDRVLNRASSVEILSEEYASDNAMASECCNRFMIGMARLRARINGDGEPRVIALWDGRPGDAVGGTHSAIQFALRQGLRVTSILDLAPPGTDGMKELISFQAGTSSSTRHQHADLEAPQQICAIVFVDAVGFRRLRERQVPNFFRLYLASAMDVLAEIDSVPLVKNTWGDGLYFIFESTREAGRFALGFVERVGKQDWIKAGLGFEPGVRIAVHAGPLYRIYDPIIGQWSYTGSHVTRAARLEPAAAPGRVFATLAFVALSAAEDVRDYECRIVGRMELVKNAGEIMVYEILPCDSCPDSN